MSNNNNEMYKPAIVQLTELMTITGTYVDQYYNIFLNPEPIAEVELKAYGTDGEITTIKIPNLAYLRQNCILGEGTPEGVVSAPLGTFYLDTTVETNGLYVKQGNELEISNTGWGLIATAEQLQEAIEQVNEIADNIQGVIDDSIGVHNVSSTAHIDIRNALAEKQNKIYAGNHITLSEDSALISASAWNVPIAVNSGNINHATGKGDLLDAPNSGTHAITWIQPVLSEDGTVGTSDFAVQCSEVSQGNAYNPFDNVSGTFLLMPFNATLIMYFSSPLNVRNFKFETAQNLISASEAYNATKTWQLDVSNDGSTWTTIGTFEGNDTWYQDCQLDYSGFYNYLRFIPLTPLVISGQTVSDKTALTRIIINACQQKVITSADTLYFKVGGLYDPITYTNTYEQLITANNIKPIDISLLNDGMYNILLDSEQSVVPVAKTIYRQAKEPLSTTVGDMWIDLSQDPYQFKSLLNARQVFGATDGVTTGYINSLDAPEITEGSTDYIPQGVLIYATPQLVGSPIATASGNDYYIVKSSDQVITQVPYRSALDSVYSYWNAFDGTTIWSNVHQGGSGQGYARKNIPNLSKAYIDVAWSAIMYNHGDAGFGQGSYYIWGGLRIVRMGHSNYNVIQAMRSGKWVTIDTYTDTTTANLYVRVTGTVDNVTIRMGRSTNYTYTWSGDPRIDARAINDRLDLNTSVNWWSGEGSVFENCVLPEYVKMTVPAGAPEVYPANSWEVIPYTPIGKITVESGKITSTETFNFNDGCGKLTNSHMIARYSLPDLGKVDSTTYVVGATGTPQRNGWIYLTNSGNSVDTIDITLSSPTLAEQNIKYKTLVMIPLPAGTSFKVTTANTTIYWYPCIGDSWEY